jgi:hypothetical protein
MEDVILVTGCDLARSSTNVAFSESQRREQVSFGVTTTTDSSGVNIQWQFSRENTRGVTFKRGPNGQVRFFLSRLAETVSDLRHHIRICQRIGAYSSEVFVSPDL